MKQDHLADKIHNGYIYIYGNKEDHVWLSPIRHHCPHNTKINLDPFGYKPCQYTPGLREHKTRDIKFCLVVDDFGIKYTNDNNLQHILSYLHFFFTILVDMKGDLFCGITLKWDYSKQTFQLSMPDYVRLALERFQHRWPTVKTDAPHEWKEPVYGLKQQNADNNDTSPLLSQ